MKNYLINDRIRLRALEPEDIELLYSWENDTENWKVSHTLVPYSKYILALYIKNSDKDIYETKQLRLMVETTEGKTVGAIDLFDFDPYHLRAGIGLLIHNHDDRSKGYAAAALELLITYCFKRLNLHQLYANIGSENTISLAFFQKYGFSICASKKEWNRTESGWEDELLLQLINI